MTVIFIVYAVSVFLGRFRIRSLISPALIKKKHMSITLLIIYLFAIPTLIKAQTVSTSCISIVSYSDYDGGIGAPNYVSASCPSTHPTFVSCGYKTRDDDTTTVRGNLINFANINQQSDGDPIVCSAVATLQSHAVFAVARCCNFTTIDLTCDAYQINNTVNNNLNEDVETTLDCSDNNPAYNQFLTSCSPYNNGLGNGKGTRGVYPFASVTNLPTSPFTSDHIVVNHSTSCTTFTPKRSSIPYYNDPFAINVEAACCSITGGNSDMTCVDVVVNWPGEQTTTVDCSTSGLQNPFLADCSGYVGTDGVVIKYV